MTKIKYIEKLKQVVADFLSEKGIINAEIIVETPPSLDLGDVAFPMFKFAKELRMAPAQIGAMVQETIKGLPFVDSSIVKGPYLNVFFNRNLFAELIIEEVITQKEDYGQAPAKDSKVLIEFSCPNTNKPLHLGHCRNNVLGDSMARIHKKAGFQVETVNLINDRGIHICKSMLAYQLFGKNTTPELAQKKSDHLVGDFYVTYAVESEKNPELEKQAQQMLLQWEAEDADVRKLWETMNSWAINGLMETYESMGIAFDHYQYESNTYVFGKDLITQGLKDKVFYKEEDGSVWVNNEDIGLDKKIVLRNDGTSVYHAGYWNSCTKKQIHWF